MEDLTKVSISAVTLGLIIMSEPLYSEAWFEESAQQIQLIQEDAKDISISLWKIYTDSLYVLVVLPAFICYFLSMRARSYYYMVNLSAAVAITQIGKLHYAQPRPYMVQEQVQAFKCSTGYGNPSGHNVSVMGVFLAVFLDYNTWCSTDRKKSQPSNWSLWYWRLILALCTTILVGTMAYSRMYMGVHSLNQVFYGLLLGAWLALTLEYIFKDFILGQAESLLAAEVEHDLSRLFWATTTLFVTVFAIQIVNYEADRERFELPDSTYNMILSKCDEKVLGSSIADKALTSYGQVAVAFGAAYGLLAQRLWTPGIIAGEVREDSNAGDKFASLGTAILAILPGIAMFAFMFVELEPYPALFLEKLIPYFLITFCMFFVADIARRDFGLLKTARSAAIRLITGSKDEIKKGPVLILLP